MGGAKGPAELKKMQILQVRLGTRSPSGLPNALQIPQIRWVNPHRGGPCFPCASGWPLPSCGAAGARTAALACTRSCAPGACARARRGSSFGAIVAQSRMARLGASPKGP
jgi:hypothetical protein